MNKEKYNLISDTLQHVFPPKYFSLHVCPWHWLQLDTCIRYIKKVKSPNTTSLLKRIRERPSFHMTPGKKKRTRPDFLRNVLHVILRIFKEIYAFGDSEKMPEFSSVHLPWFIFSSKFSLLSELVKSGRKWYISFVQCCERGLY